MNLVHCLVLLGTILPIEMKSMERMTVARGDSFAFDCPIDQSLYFAERLGDWSEIQEHDEKFQYFNMKFDFLEKEKILRVKIDSAQNQHQLYFGCRKANWASTSMSQIFQIIVADVQSFYWTYICHGPAGSCDRIDDPKDETRSSFEVADQTRVDLYCCASLNGFDNVDLRMNSVGNTNSPVDIKRNEELDGSLVICANQHSSFKQSSSRQQQLLECELVVDGRPYSKLSSSIRITDRMPIDPSFTDRVPHTAGDNNYFNRNAARRRIPTVALVFIIIGSIILALILIFIFVFVCIKLCRKQANSSSAADSTHYQAVSSKNSDIASNKSKFHLTRPKDQTDPSPDSAYLKPAPLYQNQPIIIRC